MESCPSGRVSLQITKLEVHSLSPQKSPETTTLEEKCCRVCQAASDGSHFGVEACRACAAFFRRSIVLSKEYICRQQGAMCKIFKGTRMCRKCRFEKCARLGMIADQVQNRPAEKEDTYMHASPSSSESPIYDPVKLSIGQIAPMLHDMNEKFKHFLAVQKSVEFTMVEGGQMPRDAFDTVIHRTERPLATFPTMCRLARAILPCLIEFVQSVLPPIPTLSTDEMWHIYRAFSPGLWIFESAYFTYKFNLGANLLMFTQTTVIDMENTRHFYENSVVEHNVDTLANMLKECMHRDMDMVRQLRELEPTEIEVIGLLGILLWDQNAACEKESLVQLASEQRDKIFQELNSYYRFVLNIPDYAVRLGKLMCLYSSLQHNAGHFKEELELFNIMNLFQADTFIYDFIKR
ncbi:unnamed protein product, partial [Mesorhabditis belari]|uniref:Uncharacterized protein n=1 Tax=Mesorhabditis belari TaxID=2138241 RepID=A0AAF3ERD5_9BILA